MVLKFGIKYCKHCHLGCWADFAQQLAKTITNRKSTCCDVILVINLEFQIENPGSDGFNHVFVDISSFLYTVCLYSSGHTYHQFYFGGST